MSCLFEVLEWAIPENIHTQPPLPSEIPECVTPPPPSQQNSKMVNPPTLRNFRFFWKYISDLATPV